MGNKEVIAASSYDQGTTNGKAVNLYYHLNGEAGERLHVVREPWTTNINSEIELTFEEETPNGSEFKSSQNACWYGENQGNSLYENLYSSRMVYSRDRDIYAASGASATPVAVFDRKVGKLLAIFTEKSLSTIPLSDITQDALAQFSLGQIDVTRQVRKLAVIRQEWDQIAKKLGVNISLDDIFVMPMTSALLQDGVNPPLGTLGWTLAEARGITNGIENNNQLQMVYDILSALGYVSGEHFTIQELEAINYGNKHIVVGADFLKNLEALSVFGEDLYKPDRDILLEGDSVFKLFKSNKNKVLVPGLNKINGLGPYGLIRDGAGMNRVLMDLCRPELENHSGDFYKYLNDLAAIGIDELSENPFIFIPYTDGNISRRRLMMQVQGIYREVNFEQFVNTNIKTKIQIITAVYAGIGCMLRDMLGEETTNLVIYGGFLKEDQLGKMQLLLGPLGRNTNVDWLQMGDSGEMTALIAMRKQYGDKVVISEKIKRIPLKRKLDLGWYYEKWKRESIDNR